MNATCLRFFVSHVGVEVRSSLEDVVQSLSGVWAGCAKPIVPTTCALRFTAEACGDGFSITGDDQVLCNPELREDVLPLLESAIYRAIPAWHDLQVLLHAACVRRGPTSLLLLGRSGAGKSSLALAAVRRGFEYYSDEITITDGMRVWGVPRAIQFEPIADGGQPPPWAPEVDLQHYHLRLPGGRRATLPFWLPPADQIPTAPAAANQLCVYAVERGPATLLEPCSPIEALALLHEAAFRPPSLDLGRLVRPGRCGRLSWRDPESAIDLLLEGLEQ
jgi:hypothetical protein